MESDDQQYNDNINKLRSKPKHRSLQMLLSSIEDNICIHTELNISNIENMPVHKEETKDEDLNKHSGNIFDINSNTKNLTSEEIKERCIKALLVSTKEQNESYNQSEFEVISYVDDEKRLKDEDKNDFGLKERTKYQKLTHDQLKFLKNIINQSNLTTSQISKEYKVSPSQINKIKQMKDLKIAIGPHKRFVKLKKHDKKILANEIIKFNEINKYPYYASDITAYVNNQLRWDYTVQFVRSFMKNELNFTYKRIKSRPNNVNLDRLYWIRTLFSINFSQIMNLSTLLINIDETSIGRHTKVNYSWGLKGYPIEAKNIFITGSVSSWMAILSNGAWISMVTDSMFDSNRFALFLQHLFKWIEDNKNFGFSEVMVIMDNWSIHKSANVRTLLKKQKITIAFIPPYSPHLAPIEMYFGLFKKCLISNLGKQTINIQNKDNFNRVLESFKGVNSSTIKNIFGRFYKEIQNHLNVLHFKLKQL